MCTWDPQIKNLCLVSGSQAGKQKTIFVKSWISRYYVVHLRVALDLGKVLNHAEIWDGQTDSFLTNFNQAIS